MKTSLPITVVLALAVLNSGIGSAQGSPRHQYQVRGSDSQTIEGTTYGSSHASGLATSAEGQLGVSSEKEHGKEKTWFAGAGGTVQAGHFTDSEVSQSGRVGEVEVRNYARGSTFVGAEAGAQAGVGKDGLKAGVSAFSGARAVGKVGSDFGAVGYGARGEAWTGIGAEASATAKVVDGKLKIGGELGAGLAVGGKIGVEFTVDVRAARKVTRDVGRGLDKVGKDVGRKADRAGKDVARAFKKFAGLFR